MEAREETRIKKPWEDLTPWLVRAWATQLVCVSTNSKETD